MGIPIVTISSEGTKLDPAIQVLSVEGRRDLNRIPEATKKRPKAPATPGPVDLSELLARSLAGAKQGPRAANENHRPTKKARTTKKPHAETHHRKSA